MKESIIGTRLFKTMKRSNGIRALFIIGAGAMLLTIFSIDPAYGQNDPNETRAEKPQVQYPSEELELLRSRMLDLLDTVQDFSSIINPNDGGGAERLVAARRYLEQFSLKDLNALRASLDPSKLKDLTQERSTINDFRSVLEAKRKSRELTRMDANSALPAVDDPDLLCYSRIGSGRPASAVIIAADKVYFQAKILDAALNRGCNQVDVGGTIIVGFGSIGGGNHSNDCIGSDHILITAEEIRNIVTACNVDFTNRAVDAAVKRLEAIHSDLQGSEQNITSAVESAKTVIDTKATENLTMLIQNALLNKESVTSAIGSSKDSLKGAISESTDSVNLAISLKADTLKLAIGDSTTSLATAVGAGTNTVFNNDNTNKDMIVINDNANRVLLLADAKANRDFLQVDAKTNRDFLQSDAKANRDFLQADARANRDFLQADAKSNREFLLRTQIEADLSSADAATFVALFLTPSTTCSQPVLNDKGLAVAGTTQCGYLDFARAVVVQTIINLAGTNAASANSFLAKGDAARTSGDYRQAYVNYRLAYKAAIK